MTKRESECLAYIKYFWQEHDYGPSFREVMLGLGLKSPSGVNRLVEALLLDGKLEDYEEGSARSLKARIEKPDFCPRCFYCFK